MPITGKIKDVTDIPPNKNDFDFRELEINNLDKNIKESTETSNHSGFRN